MSSTSTLAYLSGAIVHPTQLTWFDRTGRALGAVGTEAVYNDLSLSPDETRVAIYVESYPRGSQKERISPAGGTQPRWRRDGKELFYISPDLKLMAVEVKLGTKLEFGPPHELFQTRLSLNGTLPFRMLRYDVTRDGKRFLINSEPGSVDAAAPPITVVLNWTGMLK